MRDVYTFIKRLDLKIMLPLGYGTVTVHIQNVCWVYIQGVTRVNLVTSIVLQGNSFAMCAHIYV